MQDAFAWFTLVIYSYWGHLQITSLSPSCLAWLYWNILSLGGYKIDNTPTSYPRAVFTVELSLLLLISRIVWIRYYHMLLSLIRQLLRDIFLRWCLSCQTPFSQCFGVAKSHGVQDGGSVALDKTHNSEYGKRLFKSVRCKLFARNFTRCCPKKMRCICV